jgi:hypothetical protein
MRPHLNDGATDHDARHHCARLRQHLPHPSGNRLPSLATLEHYTPRHQAHWSTTMYGGDFVPLGILVIFVTWAYLSFREET